MTHSSDDDDDGGENLQYKVIVMGDGAVGKTSLINRFCQDGFGQSYKQTIGVDFFNKKVVLPGNVTVTLQIWDIGGQQVGGKMLGKYIFGAAAVLFVYDTTNPETFKNIDDWYGFVCTEFKGMKRPFMGLIGNKVDLQHLKAVKTEKHTLYAIEHQMASFYVSAKSGEKVQSTFTRVAADLSGITLSKAEVDAMDTVVTAAIVDHPAAPVSDSKPRGPPKKKEEEDDGCVVQ